MKRLLMLLGVVMCARAALALPEISMVSFGADDPSRPWAIRVNYQLVSEPAVITFEVQTNGVPVEGIAYEHATGDVNHLYQPGAHSFVWQSDLDWPCQYITSPSVKIVVKAAPRDCPPDYVLFPICASITSVSPVLPAPFYYDKEADIPGEITDYRYKTEWFVMRKIHARGKMYRQGRKKVVSDDSAYFTWERSRLVAMTNDFYIGVYELTARQARTMCRSKGVNTIVYANACFKNDVNKYNDYLGNHTEVSMTRALAGPTPKYYYYGAPYCWPETGLEVSSGHMIAGLRDFTFPSMHFPMSYQWEYAARAGTDWDFYKPLTEATNTFWYAGNNAEDPNWVEGYNFPHAVGLREPNAWGLYDMLGNVSEWCRDGTFDRSASPAVDAAGWPAIEPDGPYLGVTRPSKYLMGGNFKCNSAGSCYVSSSDRISFDINDTHYGARFACDAYAVR